MPHVFARLLLQSSPVQMLRVFCSRNADDKGYKRGYNGMVASPGMCAGSVQVRVMITMMVENEDLLYDNG